MVVVTRWLRSTSQLTTEPIARSSRSTRAAEPKPAAPRSTVSTMLCISVMVLAPAARAANGESNPRAAATFLDPKAVNWALNRTTCAPIRRIARASRQGLEGESKRHTGTTSTPGISG